MQVFELTDPATLRVRAHPWTRAEGDAAHRYVDFREHPELIRTSLEDLRPWADHAFTEAFYRLIEWLNGPESLLESNDCAFSGVQPNDSPHSARRLQASGRLMVLFRHLPSNTRPDRIGELTERVARALSASGQDLEAVVGVSIVEVLYTALPGPPERRRGQQLMLSFWAWGDDEAQVFGNVDRTLGHLTEALRSVG
jgi:hypothetical protein